MHRMPRWMICLGLGLGLGVACVAPTSFPTVAPSPTPIPLPVATATPAPTPTATPVPSPTSPPSPTPWTPPPGLDPAVYPAPTPADPAVLLTYSAACPNLEGVEESPPPRLEEVLALLREASSPDLRQRLQATDPAFWPLVQGISPSPEGLPRPEALMPPRPGIESPYGELLRNGCGEAVMARTWWVEVCPGPCANPEAARLESLKEHLFLIRRHGRWLIWAKR